MALPGEAQWLYSEYLFASTKHLEFIIQYKRASVQLCAHIYVIVNGAMITPCLLVETLTLLTTASLKEIEFFQLQLVSLI